MIKNCLVCRHAFAIRTSSNKICSECGKKYYLLRRLWFNIRERCLNPKNVGYARYGGRGIKVCERWLNLSNFISDLHETYTGLTLDRINNNGDYEPANCRWATVEQQAQNRRTNVYIEYKGIRDVVPNWAKFFGIKKATLYQRIKGMGWDIERALTTPVEKRGYSH